MVNNNDRQIDLAFDSHKSIIKLLIAQMMCIVGETDVVASLEGRDHVVVPEVPSSSFYFGCHQVSLHGKILLRDRTPFNDRASQRDKKRAYHHLDGQCHPHVLLTVNRVAYAVSRPITVTKQMT